MDGRGINEIRLELLELFNQQMNTLSQAGSIDGLKDDELKSYNERRKRIQALTHELSKFARKN